MLFKEKLLQHPQDDIMTCVHGLQTAFKSQDIEAALTHYESSAIVCLSPGEPAQGINAIRSVFKQIFKAMPHYSFGAYQLLINGSVATYSVVWKMRSQADGTADVIQEGLSSTLLRKQDDGRWLIAIDNPHAQLLKKQCLQCVHGTRKRESYKCLKSN